jgi:hypothetical protein
VTRVLRNEQARKTKQRCPGLTTLPTAS